MKYIVIPSENGTHTNQSGQKFNVFETSDNTILSGPGELLNSKTGLTELNPKGARVDSPRDISKLTIRRRLRELGKEDAFDAALDAIAHARSDWDDAQVVSTGDAMFTTHAEALKGSLGLTNDQFTALIAAY